MKLNLGIQDALVLRSLLLEMGGSYGELVLAKKTAEDVISVKELATYRVQNTPQGIVWQTTTEDGKPLPITKEVELGPQVTNMLKSTFIKLDEAKALKHYHVSLYEQIVQPAAA